MGTAAIIRELEERDREDREENYPFFDGNGNRIDGDGNPVDENGNPIAATGGTTGGTAGGGGTTGGGENPFEGLGEDVGGGGLGDDFSAMVADQMGLFDGIAADSRIPNVGDPNTSTTSKGTTGSIAVNETDSTASKSTNTLTEGSEQNRSGSTGTVATDSTTNETFGSNTTDTGTKTDQGNNTTNVTGGGTTDRDSTITNNTNATGSESTDFTNFNAGNTSNVGTVDQNTTTNNAGTSNTQGTTDTSFNKGGTSNTQGTTDTTFNKDGSSVTDINNVTTTDLARNESTRVADELGFGKALSDSLGGIGEGDELKLSALSDLINNQGMDSGFQNRMNTAVNQALSGPQMAAAGQSANERIASRAAAEVGQSSIQNVLNATNQLSDPTGLANAAAVGRQFAGEDMTGGETGTASTVGTESSNYTEGGTSSAVTNEATNFNETGSSTANTNESTNFSEAGSSNMTGTTTDQGTFNETGGGTANTNTQNNTNTVGTEQTSEETSSWQDAINNFMNTSEFSNESNTTGYRDALVNALQTNKLEGWSDSDISQATSILENTEASQQSKAASLGQMFGTLFGTVPEQGGGKSIMCIVYWHHGYITHRVLQDDFLYAREHIDDDTRRAYFFLTTWLANYLISKPRDHWAVRLWRKPVCSWAQEMHYRASGQAKQNRLGAAMCKFGVPTFRLIGKLLFKCGYTRIIPPAAEYALSLIKQHNQNVLSNYLTAQIKEI